VEVKFDRNYVLKIQRTDDPTRSIEIKRPFTIDFEIVRNYLSSGCNSRITIFNLGENSRSQIRKDQYEYALYKSVSLNAGYGNDLSTLFIGQVDQAWSVRQGVEYSTVIEAHDTGQTPQLADVSTSYKAGTSNRSIILDLISKLEQYGIQPGAIGNIDGKLTRGAAYSGNAIDILRDLTGGSFFIDAGRANVIFNDEFIDGGEFLISPETGLIGTPVQQGFKTTLDMLLEPKLFIGRKIRIEIDTEKNFNGSYKVIALKHKAIISDAVGGPAVTTLELEKLTPSFRSVKFEAFN
jgi:hypothetical protein